MEAKTPVRFLVSATCCVAFEVLEETSRKELRRQILIAAFGGRTLHLDLRLAHPRRPDPVADVTGHRKFEHGLGSAPLSRYYDPDTTAPKTWRCPARLKIGASPARRVKGDIYPNRDNCLAGEPVFCQLWPPENVVGTPGKRSVGALGWLRACRQAYAKGIDVLYSTNTFFIESRLASITSLELRWEILLFGRDGQEPKSDEDRAHLASQLGHLCEAFANLRTLVLSFRDPLYCDFHIRPAQRLGEIDRVLLRPLAEASSRLPLRAQEQHVVVELPWNVFCDLNGLDRVSGLALEAEQKGEEWGDGSGTWLRYPVPAARSTHEGKEEKTQDGKGSQSNGGLFY
ncbi:hypothetical protein MMYC01_204702 [Madurella mycetomatis]|uniref:Uncharacterized protein n=1 Tax=Madurella mycetomatis TaxID=100816 RepID=A0A175W8N7_9PEZI|nr:hypothetical protein MMYC01_204702 [Madurella mycetomatis]